MKKETLTKSKERVKELGEVFTPATLVSEMLDKLPPECWLPEKTFLEPSCGTGNFLVQILQRKLDAGHPPLVALSTIYGVDIMQDNIDESKKRILELLVSSGEVLDYRHERVLDANIICGNALDNATMERFVSLYKNGC